MKLEIRIEALDAASSRVRAVARELEKISATATRVGEKVQSLTSTLASFTRSVAKWATIAGTALSGVAGGALAVVVRANASFEKMRITLTTLYKDAQKAEQVFRQIEEFASRTPYTIEELVDAWIMLKAYGLEPTIETLQIIGDAVSALGGGRDAFEGIVRALGQIATKGKVSAEELLQLAERGIPAYQILAEKLGLSAEQLEKIGNLGIDARVAIEALLEGMKERFGGNMEKMANSWEGLMGRLKSAWQKFLRMVGDTGAFEYVKEKLAALVALVEQAFDSGKAQEWAHYAGIGVKVIAEGLVAVAKIAKEVVLLFFEVGAAVIQAGQQLYALSSQVDNFWTDAAKATLATFVWGANKFAALVATFLAKVAGFVLDLHGWFQSKFVVPLMTAFETAWEVFKNEAKGAIAFVLKELDKLLEGLSKLPWLGEKIPRIETRIDYRDVSPAQLYEELLRKNRVAIHERTEEIKRWLLEKPKEFFERNAAIWKEWATTNTKTGGVIIGTTEKVVEKTIERMNNSISVVAKTAERVGEITRAVSVPWTPTPADQDTGGPLTLTTAAVDYSQPAKLLKRTKKRVSKSLEKASEAAVDIPNTLADGFRLLEFRMRKKFSSLVHFFEKLWPAVESFRAGRPATAMKTLAGAALSMVSAAVGGPAGLFDFFTQQLLQNKKLNEGISKLFEAVQKILDPIASVIAPVLSAIAEVIVSFKPVFDLIANLLKPVAWAAKILANAVSSVVSPVLRGIENLLEGLWQVLTPLREAVEALVNLLKNPGKAIEGAVEGIPIVGDVIGGVVDVVDSIIGGIGDVFGGLFHHGGVIRAHAGAYLLPPLSADEVPIVAQAGEFVVNRESARRYLPVLKQINEGTYSPQNNVVFNVTITVNAEKFDRDLVERELVPILEDLVRRGKVRW